MYPVLTAIFLTPHELNSAFCVKKYPKRYEGARKQNKPMHENNILTWHLACVNYVLVYCHPSAPLESTSTWLTHAKCQVKMLFFFSCMGMFCFHAPSYLIGYFLTQNAEFILCGPSWKFVVNAIFGHWCRLSKCFHKVYCVKWGYSEMVRPINEALKGRSLLPAPVF